MEYAVDNHTVKLIFVGCMLILTVGAYCIKTDDDVTIDNISFVIIKGDDVGVVVMSEVLLVHLKYLLIADEHISHFANFASV